MVLDVDRQLILAPAARQAPGNDCANLPALVAEANWQAKIGLALTDAQFDSERNHVFIRAQIRADSVMPAKRGKKTCRIRGVRAERRTNFPRQKYCRRSRIETVFSTVKRKLSCRAPGRSTDTQRRQALLLGLAYHLYRLYHPFNSKRMSTEPRHLQPPPYPDRRLRAVFGLLFSNPGSCVSSDSDLAFGSPFPML